MAKYDFWIDPPVMNAAGSLGFVPDWRSGHEWSRLGAFVTHPVSLGPRTPTRGTRFVPFAGGFLLHTGYPNPGFNAALNRFGPAWARSNLPVIVHLLAQNPDEVAQMVQRLEGKEGVIGIELGLPAGIDAESAKLLLEAAAGELLLVACLPFEQALSLASVAGVAGATAISLRPPRGALPDSDGQLIEGRLFGPAIFPLALQLTRQLAASGLPVLAAGGVYCESDLRTLLDAGAAAVQLDSWLWLD
jgi:dihydroorotate dehydrogenase (NAD+) catalytic subunit